MSITHLPQDVVDKIKSSVTITSLNSVVCGLLKNSLDADASKINIYVDHARGNCTIEDNGCGIPPVEFTERGGLGKLHHTSKFPTRAGLHGKHGNFLVSLAQLSLVSVVSHHPLQAAHNSLSIHNGQVLSRDVPSRPDQQFETFSYGTKVLVADLFGSMPVRVKHRAALATDRAALDKEWAGLVRAIVSILLAWSSTVSVTIRDSIVNREIRLKAPTELQLSLTTSRLLMQADLADDVDANSWASVSGSAGGLTLKGCICLIPVATRRAQFLSFGIQPVSNDLGTNLLYEEVNKIFNASSFAIVEDGNASDQENRAGTPAPGSRPRRGIDRWPMFYFRLSPVNATHSQDTNDIVDEQRGDTKTVLSLLRAVCYGFLKKHHFRPRKVELSADESVFSLSRTRSRGLRSPRPTASVPTSSSSGRSTPHTATSHIASSRSQSPFDGWNSVKIGRPTGVHKQSRSDKVEETRPHKRRQLVGEGGKLLRKPFEDIHLDSHEETTPVNLVKKSDKPEDNENGGQDLQCLDSTQKQVAASAKPHGPVPYRYTASHRQKSSASQPSEWLQGVLKKWNNPVFEVSSTTLPQLHRDHEIGAGDARHGGNRGNINFESASGSLEGRISRHALRNAEVLGQVDRKFILVKLPLDGAVESSSALIMLDQHASDERCQLEQLMDSYFDRCGAAQEFKAVVEPLDSPIHYDLSSRESQLLTQHQDHFGYWGVKYKVQQQPQQEASSVGASCSLKVLALPPTILERCRAEPRLLIDMIRKEIWKLDESVVPSATAREITHGSQTALFARCPQGILELLHSRSCRSAIMFNDVLSLEECRQLVERLSRCSFPFQCAHGRPSMAPLLDLGSHGGVKHWEGPSQTDKRAWKRWIKG